MNVLDSQLKQLEQEVEEISQKIDKLYADNKVASEEEVSDIREQISGAKKEEEHFEWQNSKIGRTKKLEVCNKVLWKATCNVLLLKNFKLPGCQSRPSSIPFFHTKTACGDCVQYHINHVQTSS